MVTPDSDTKVLDLGLARAPSDENPFTRPSTVIGTLDYSRPRTTLQRRQGRPPQRPLQPRLHTLLHPLSSSPVLKRATSSTRSSSNAWKIPPPLEQVAKGVPAAFTAIVHKFMAKEPAERYQTCAELSTDLVRWTVPAVVKVILGAEAKSAHSFRPSPSGTRRRQPAPARRQRLQPLFGLAA